MLRDIARLPSVRLISLQKHDGLDQIAALPSDMRVEELGDTFDPGPYAFVDTAAVMKCLDLVITCDTSVAHLAGALCSPTWLALMHAADWRWGESGDTTEWYSSVRLFRQSEMNAWEPVFAEMEGALREWRGAKS